MNILRNGLFGTRRQKRREKEALRDKKKRNSFWRKMAPERERLSECLPPKGTLFIPTIFNLYTPVFEEFGAAPVILRANSCADVYYRIRLAIYNLARIFSPALPR